MTASFPPIPIRLNQIPLTDHSSLFLALSPFNLSGLSIMQVFKGKYSGTVVAIKKLPSDVSDPETLKKFNNEVAMLQ